MIDFLLLLALIGTGMAGIYILTYAACLLGAWLQRYRPDHWFDEHIPYKTEYLSWPRTIGLLLVCVWLALALK